MNDVLKILGNCGFNIIKEQEASINFRGGILIVHVSDIFNEVKVELNFPDIYISKFYDIKYDDLFSIADMYNTNIFNIITNIANALLVELVDTIDSKPIPKG